MGCVRYARGLFLMPDHERRKDLGERAAHSFAPLRIPSSSGAFVTDGGGGGFLHSVNARAALINFGSRAGGM